MSTVRKPQRVRFSQRRRSRRKHHEHMIRSRFSHANSKKGTNRPNGYTELKDFVITDDLIVINLYAQRAELAMT